MFTGIVETVGEVVDVDRTADGRRLAIAAEGFRDLSVGQSISVSGVCLTVEAHGPEVAVADPDDTGGAHDDVGVFEVFLASETVERTYLGELGAGDAVNLERAMPADGRFDGHLVQGHVDAVATVESVESVGEDWRFGFSIPSEQGRYVVEKGSVALDGISLTVAERGEDAFEVAIIPTTYDRTTLAGKAPGDPVHLEVDVIAKYVEGMIDGYE